MAKVATAVELVDVNEDGVTGLLARPDTDEHVPGILAFAGSSGGLGPTASWAGALASDGFAVLAVAYFGLPGLPPALVDIDLAVIDRAAAWLRTRGRTTDAPFGVIGISRGSELALLSSVLVDGIGPVVAFAPSGVAWGGIGPNGPVDKPAWTFHGSPLPYARMRGAPGRDASTPARAAGVALRPMFDEALGDRELWAHAEIAVENLKGPLLLVSGRDDAMWPSTRMATMIVRRAGERGARHAVHHLDYPAAGHTCAGVPDAVAETVVQHPLTGATYALGGTDTGNAHARAHSWPLVVQHFSDALGR